MIRASDSWKSTYPDALLGVLVMMNVTNPENVPELDAKKKELEEDLRTLFTDKKQLKDLPTVQAYNAYYKKFKKTYHVLQQLESVVFKEKPIPKGAGLVEAMFMAELRNMLLTAGHDLAPVKEPVVLDVAVGNESYERINGSEQELKAGDMYIRDEESILSSIIYGPDRRTAIRPETERVLFTTYAVPGIGREALLQHLDGIERHVRIFAPHAEVLHKEIITSE